MSSRFVSAGGAEVKAPEGLSSATDDAWAKARKQVEESKKAHPGEPAPGTQEGGVSLYEHLQAQKAAKQEAFEEASKLRNQFRPLDDGEVDFLEGIRRKEQSQVADVRKATAEQLDAFRKERAAAEELAHEEALKQQALSDANKDAGEQWQTTKKRRRAAADDKVAGPKAIKLSSNEASAERNAALDAPATTAAVATTKETSDNPNLSTAPAASASNIPIPKPIAPPATSLVAYDSDSDG